MTDTRLKDKLASGEFFVVPGVHDMIAALMAERAGFDIVYGSGYWTTASAYGLPDAGIVTYTQMLDRMATVKRTVSSALIADADTGFGGLLNVHHTVKGYEGAGISAIQLEDQEFPKKCGHTPGKRVVPTEDMVEKIKVAVEARETMLIIARTDAYQTYGLDETLRRLEAYDKAGADILFAEAITTEEEMRKVCETFGKPVMVNIANGGVTPPLPAKDLADIGFAFSIYPSLSSLVAAKAIEQAFAQLRDDGNGEPNEPPLFDFKEFCSLIGFEDVWAFDKKWAR
ncbi:carboxyvinyl-carboxyphosphonate phosphorylmutase [Novosphingobium sp. PC22D]|uniref:isocitrate lyase/PEP mutase family protein n=1 Tax=Novosphingobium sp. PC22D TaxID=1962403 RepID=UPI000BEFB1A7|nr:isocitrate lyase/PEP mutase family protein [Novosphingobium sp. PC22D]PEQ11393.1 carboxyvinyl-carboxyphosphonate phosphorylmutase [Novosphingobium sp. PC22D]